MYVQLERALLVVLTSFCFATSAYAIPISQSTPVTGETGDFSDGANDFFGIVDVTGTMIAGTSFSNWGVTPPAGSLAGRDHDDGNSKPAIRTATWTLALPGGTVSVDSIDFTGILAAADATSPTGSNWFQTPDGSITLDLLVNAISVSTLNYLPQAGNAALGLNGGGPTVTANGIGINLTDLGGAGVTSVSLVLTAASDSGNEDWWATGTLSANAVIPEPATALLLTCGLAGLALAPRFGRADRRG